jgi:magnesium transporter
MRTLTAIDEREIKDLLARDEFFWLDLTAPGEEDMRTLGELLHLHPVAVEAASSFPERPRLEDFDGYVLLIFAGVGGQGRDPLAPFGVHMLISGSYIVTVHLEHCSPLAEVRQGLARKAPGSEGFVVYRVLDVLTDSFLTALESVDEDIDTLENAVITKTSEEQLQRIFQLKRSLVTLRRIATPQRDVLARAIDEINELPGFEPGTRDYFRDVYDHMIRVSDLIDSYRDLLTGALDVYLSTVSNRLNTVMERLTLVATIFLPLAFVTGFFGQNFGWMVRHISSFGAFLIFGVGGILVPVLIMLVVFGRAGYLGETVRARLGETRGRQVST